MREDDILTAEIEKRKKEEADLIKAEQEAEIEEAKQAKRRARQGSLDS